MKKKIFAIILSLAIVGTVGVMRAEQVFAACDNGVSTSVLGKNGCAEANEEAIFDILATIVSVITYGVGIAATAGFVWSGYNYITAGEDVGKIAKAKNRMLQIVIGLAVYAAIWAVIQFLLPGGLFGDGS